MSDFMKFLYAQYIKPYLDNIPEEEYGIYFAEMFDKMSFQVEQLYDKTQEFTVVHAFLLGLRTGRGLPK